MTGPIDCSDADRKTDDGLISIDDALISIHDGLHNVDEDLHQRCGGAGKRATPYINVCLQDRAVHHEHRDGNAHHRGSTN
jgi:hypothetical protein